MRSSSSELSLRFEWMPLCHYHTKEKREANKSLKDGHRAERHAASQATATKPTFEQLSYPPSH